MVKQIAVLFMEEMPPKILNSKIYATEEMGVLVSDGWTKYLMTWWPKGDATEWMGDFAVKYCFTRVSPAIGLGRARWYLDTAKYEL